jgi:polyvinyl alcohol dehydrogenase (cytochrome)
MKWILVVLSLAPLWAPGAEWTSAGQNIANTRHQPAELRISPDTVSRLAVKWEASLEGDVSATPAVDADSLYVTDMSGNVHRLNRESGATIWSNPVSKYTGVYGDTARVTPVFAGSMAAGENAHTMFAIDAASGEILWRFASGGSVNGGAAVVDGVVYWGSGYGLW